MKKVRVRFAPSPTGFMHVGNARTALFNYLFARHNKGDFILRIEDTDLDRHNEKAVESIFEILNWLGLEYDEVYRQSERFDIYKKYVDYLLEKGYAYECYCTKEELENMKKEQLKKGLPPRYTGKCRNLTKEEKEKLKKEGRKPVIRFKLPENEKIVWEDLVKGVLEFDSSNIGGDFVIVRSNGIPVYNFVVVIDDHLMNITHVIRGEDHISNTPKQILLYKAFNWDIPKFAHLPIILGKDKSKLSKRHGSTSVEEFRSKGYLPESLINFLALLGWYPNEKLYKEISQKKEHPEIFTKEELIELFDLKDVNPAPAIFDTTKLDFINEFFIRKLDLDTLYKHLKEFVKVREDFDIKEIGDTLVIKIKDKEFKTDKKTFYKAIDLTRNYYKTLEDVFVYLKELLTDKFEIDKKALEFIKTNPESIKVIEKFFEKVKLEQVLNKDTFKKIVKSIQKELKVKGKKLYMPIRIALTGKLQGLELDTLIEFLGKERVINRLKNFFLEGEKND